MRRLFIILLLSALSALAIGQTSMYVANPISAYMPQYAVAGEEEELVLYTDDFEEHDVAGLANQGDWEVFVGTLQVRDESGDRVVSPSTSGARGGCYFNQPFADNQFSQIVLDQVGSSNTIGVIVRADGATETGYYWYGNDTGSILRRLNNGSQTDLDVSGNTPFSATDTIRLEIIDYTLYCYINGELDTNIGVGGAYDDSGDGDRLTSGYAGIIGFGNTVDFEADDWSGGNLAAAEFSYPQLLDTDTYGMYLFDELSTITKDATDSVGVWEDYFGNGQSFTASDANQPIWSSTGITFNGTSNGMAFTDATLDQPVFIYVVLRQISWADENRIFNGNAGTSVYLKQNGTSPTVYAYAGDGSSGGYDHLTLGDFAIVRVLFNGASSILRVNEEAASVDTNFGTGDLNGFRIGFGTADALWSNIQVAALILRLTVDDGTDQQIIYDWLEGKYID